MALMSSGKRQQDLSVPDLLPDGKNLGIDEFFRKGIVDDALHAGRANVALIHN